MGKTLKLKPVSLKGVSQRTVRGDRNSKVDTSKLTLPTELSEPPVDIGAYTLLIYGRKKIGKTSLTSQFPKTLCLMFEPGGKALRIYQRPVNHWEEFLRYIELLHITNHDYKTVTIDTGKSFYECVFKYVCDKYNVDHPSEADKWDKTKVWKAIEKEMTLRFCELLDLNLGVIVIAHEEIKPIELLNSERIQPDLGKQATGLFNALIDTIGYYHYEGERRILTIKGTDLIEAGTRCEENFLCLQGDKEEKVQNIPMGNSSEEAYLNIVKAFNNEQKTTGKEFKKKSEISLTSTSQTETSKLTINKKPKLKLKKG